MTDTRNVGSRLRNAATEIERADALLGEDDLSDQRAAQRYAMGQALYFTREAMGTKTCPECAHEFATYTRRRDARFCSMRCAQRAANRALAERLKA